MKHTIAGRCCPPLLGSGLGKGNYNLIHPPPLHHHLLNIVESHSSRSLKINAMIRQKTLERACPVCKANNNLVYCAGCKVMPYCGRDHQDAHGGAHENQCTKVKNTREELQAEDIKLRNVEGDSATAANPFETSVGHFWSIMETRDYMRARYEHIEALLQIDQLDATIAGRDHIEDMLRLCRSDNMYLRDLLPSLYLRLGQDQQCYDFIKWYFTEGQRGDYDWGNMDLPFLNLVDEDAFENPEVFLHPSGELAHKLAIMLLKIRLLFDLRRLQKSKALYTQTELPQEVKDEISRNLVGNIVSSKRE